MAIREKTLVNGDKRYQAAVYIRGENKYIYSSWMKLKRDANAAEVKLQHELYTGAYVKETKITFDEAITIYFDLIASDKIAESSLYNYKSLYKSHLKDYFGSRPISSIKSFEIQQLWKNKQKTLANSTIIKLHTLMNKVFKQFIKWEELKNNPLDGVDKPSVRNKPAQIWSKNEAKMFLSVAKEYQAYMLFWISLNTGMRLGECLGLTWDCVDFVNNKIIVQQQYSRLKKKIVYHTKTSRSMREIDLSQKQMDILLNHKEHQKIKTNIVCSNEIGGFLMERNIRRAKKSICKRANIKEITFHELRHTHASMLVDMNEPIKYVQERLGHTDVKTTLNLYVHTQKSHHRKTAERFSDYFND